MSKKKLAAGIMITYLAMIAVAFRGPSVERLPAKSVAKKTDVQLKLERFIGDEYIAECLSKVEGHYYWPGVGKVRKAYVLAAIAKQESGFRPQIIGDNGESYGLFQIQAKHHGRVPDGIQQQIGKCQSILEPLIIRRGLAAGVQKYNGRGKRAVRYSRSVLRHARAILRS